MLTKRSTWCNCGSAGANRIVFPKLHRTQLTYDSRTSWRRIEHRLIIVLPRNVQTMTILRKCCSVPYCFMNKFTFFEFWKSCDQNPDSQSRDLSTICNSFVLYTLPKMRFYVTWRCTCRASWISEPSLQFDTLLQLLQKRCSSWCVGELNIPRKKLLWFL